MKSVAASGLVIAAILSIGLGGCGSSSKSDSASSASSTAPATTTTTVEPQAKVAPRPNIEGPNPTIAGYLKQSGVTQTPVHRGDPGAPVIDLPTPDGWVDAGPDTPKGAYYAVIYTGPEAHNYTPSIVAVVSKLTGDVDQQKILDLAPGELKNLPQFAPMGDGSSTTLSGFPGYQSGGTWVDNGLTKMIAQKTVVIPGSDGLYMLQLSADCLEDQLDVAAPATITIDDQTKITT
ncbi:LpqN/LpqT family lipoprotein [Mycobacterium shimoidei]|uniref:Lipoprotein LpqN n=1 Tax=Mycobacterium shimoidei TaxID=29313 RepID=A0A1E3T4X2_MYCSH|nr:LpqN/LpqT family lipoprotein [Mycobacterium shimoidei]MCV7258203.1 LpqN/LpqT family lipoprotein [Mycobacterium shimoidei]ODR08933.1 hypothetical protein BHQ16_20190 [Mycobacterium shimoidei]ORW82316.1 hypothetical protein AWC26_05110 [Mycobacterium shimoidei]SRX95556.1 hypothetical protein MSP7336_03825 [Mycobacterium shimoidei]